MHVELPSDLEKKVRDRARSLGLDVDVYVTRLLDEDASRLTLEELMADVHEDYRKSGITSDEFDQLGRELIDKVRAERDQRPRSP